MGRNRLALLLSSPRSGLLRIGLDGFYSKHGDCPKGKQFVTGRPLVWGILWRSSLRL